MWGNTTMYLWRSSDKSLGFLPCMFRVLSAVFSLSGPIKHALKKPWAVILFWLILMIFSSLKMSYRILFYIRLVHNKRMKEHISQVVEGTHL